MNDKFYLKLIYNDQITIEFYIKILNLEQDQVEMSKGSPKSPKINVGSIVHQKNTLEQKVKMLEQEKKDLEKYYQDKLAQTHDYFSKLLLEHEIKCSQKIKNIQKYNYLVQNNVFIQYPILKDMLDYVELHEASSKYSIFCTLAYLLNSKLYSFLQHFIPIIPERTCRDMLKDPRDKMKSDICSINNFLNIVKSQLNNPIPLTLGGDAASIKPFGEKCLTSMYTYMILALSKSYHVFPIHICPTTNGTSSQDIVDKYKFISAELKKLGNVVKFISTDGDKSFNSTHENFFVKVKKVLSKNTSFEEKFPYLTLYIYVRMGGAT